ncbi:MULTISPECIES: hypothetical protein [unclassified Ensifer]|uniref:hypothetical protein n=1 Tax=unclassified Ensifer TaxID=2633371 RepID=UPI0007146F7B|nr:MULTISPECIES: hypothetical protein [unclassified Ensifer]KQX40929.1 hypothetical protein ASD49_15830 [Ensifer sp. Root1298]KQX70250.1 hypothetical protein ASD41_16905 [Ensifer sp. Root1312]KRC14490.1 hypothetical protein ASE29_17385 [Ensifer sp. Root74]KRD57028.1 hypothetical protein ASE71_10800 [Ensifer sp. Root954]
MTSLFADTGSLLVLTFMLLLALIAGHWIHALSYERRSANLPLATKDHSLGLKVAEKRAEVLALEEKRSKLDQEISDRDRLVAETASQKELLDRLRLEYDQLREAKEEIEKTRLEAAEMAAEYAKVSQSLEAAREEMAAIDRAKTAHELEKLDYQRRLEEYSGKLEELKHEGGQIESGLVELRSERDWLLGLRNEVTALEAKKAILADELADLETRLQALDEMQTQHAELTASIRMLGQQIGEKEDEGQRLAARADAISTQVAEAERQLSRLADDKQRHDQLRREVDRMDEELQKGLSQKSRLEAQIAVLEQEASKLADSLGGTSSSSETSEEIARDLLVVPESLKTPPTVGRAHRTEDEALYNVASYLDKRGLKFSDRILRAFHTSLKINDHAQMTVLAGVSGTGKSQLPRRYSEAMGIHFLQIAVEPRWDSPQDLLGFYNYIEKKYRATDFARALVHMDPYNTSGLSDRSFEDQMLLILLDEMNLARVEYYFSEFLSRLEARPQFKEVGEAIKRRDAQLPIDIRATNALKTTLSVFPGHNVLFAGTMNDDESTQSLSDKVLDRSNVMQFSAPVKFEQLKAEDRVEQADKALPFAQWRSWIKPSNSMGDSDRTKTEHALQNLADIMKSCGRPFGFRLHEAVMAYVANYPRRNNLVEEINAAISDQIEFRILPKLRGVEVEPHDSDLRRLAEVVRQDLGDQAFGDEIEATIDRGTNTGLFSWRGIQRR